MQVSTRRGISYPVAGRTDAPDIPLHFANLIAAIDLDTPLYTGTEAAKPAANTRVQGSWYWATDSSTLYFNTGSSWLSLAPLASPTFSGNPAAPTQAVTDSSTKLATTAFVRSIMPAGIIAPYAGAAAPAGWLLCDGSSQLRATYPDLFAAIGVVYGSVDGTHFTLPDLRGRVAVGKSAAGTFLTLGSIGGEETHVLTVGEMPVHAHTLSSDSAGTPSGSVTVNGSGTLTTGFESSDHVHAGSVGNTVLGTSSLDVTTGGASARIQSLTLGSTGFTTGGRSSAHTHDLASHAHTASFAGNALAAHTHTIGNSGSGTAHNNLQPYIVLNYIIKI